MKDDSMGVKSGVKKGPKRGGMKADRMAIPSEKK